MTHFQQGDPSSPDSAVGIILGDYAVFRLTLSSEFSTYMHGTWGQMLMDSLKMTFLHYFDLGIPIEFLFDINQ